MNPQDESIEVLGPGNRTRRDGTVSLSAFSLPADLSAQSPKSLIKTPLAQVYHAT